MQFGKGILPAKEYLSNGLFSIQNCYSEAESSFNQQLHFHDFYELSLIYEGSSRFLINGSSFVAAAGSLQLIRPSDYHRQMTDTGEYIRYYNLIFRQEVLSNVLLDALEEAVEPFCFQMQEKEMQKMTQLLLELKREQEEKEAFWEKMSADLIEKICILILRKSPKKRQAKEEEIPEADVGCGAEGRIVGIVFFFRIPCLYGRNLFRIYAQLPPVSGKTDAGGGKHIL